jgi:hypothetical protein
MMINIEGEYIHTHTYAFSVGLGFELTFHACKADSLLTEPNLYPIFLNE